MCYFCHAQLFETTHAENIKSPLVQHSCRNAKVVEAFCDANCPPSTRCRASLHAHMHVVSLCRCAYDRRQRSHPISIALAASQCPTSRDFVPWRFLVAGRINVRSVSPSRRPKTCTHADEPGWRRQVPPVHYDRAVFPFGELGGHRMNRPAIQPIKPENGMGASGAKTRRPMSESGSRKSGYGPNQIGMLSMA